MVFNFSGTDEYLWWWTYPPYVTTTEASTTVFTSGCESSVQYMKVGTARHHTASVELASEPDSWNQMATFEVPGWRVFALALTL